MVEIGFGETVLLAGLAAFVLFIASMPVGAKAGRRIGRRLLTGSLAAFLLTVAAAALIATGNGGMDAFKLEFGIDGLLQIGVFLLMVLFTTYFFASRYLDGLDRGTQPERETDA